ncbi:conserved hypothetical protein [Ricinus communis]|uniref:Uncharacterized protein n=1 Tax=Ricinus communis TaxID=3988 RepID=B9S873_RICCO|nr:conserved hypothetical protein [Ricinus communis]
MLVRMRMQGSHNTKVQQIERVVIGSEGDNEDLENEPVQESEINDGLEDDKFSYENEEHLEVRRHLRWTRLHNIIKSRYDEATSSPPWKNSDTVKS